MTTHLAGRGIWGDPKITLKSHQIASRLQGNEKHENWSRCHPESWKMRPVIMRIATSAKADLCNTVLSNCWLFKPQTCRIRPNNHQKIKPGDKHDQNTYFSVQDCQQPLNMVSLIFIKNDTNRNLDLKVSFLVLPLVPISFQGPQLRLIFQSGVPIFYKIY